MPESNRTIHKLLKSIQNCGIEVTVANKQRARLYHELEQGTFETAIRSVISENQLIPQNANWMPGTPTGEQADWGFYVCDKSDSGDSVDIWISMDEIHWC